MKNGRETKVERTMPSRRNTRRTTSKPQDVESQGTAQTIKKVATTLFASKGFKSTSVKDITEYANANIGAINYHFDSKENLLQEIVKDYTSINLQSVVRTLKKKADTITELRIIFEIAMRDLFEIAYEYRDVMRIIRRELTNMPEEVKNILAETILGINNILKGFIESGKEKDLISKDVDAMQFVLLVYSYVTTLSSDEIFPLSKLYSDKDIASVDYKEHAIASLSQILFYGIATRE